MLILGIFLLATIVRPVWLAENLHEIKKNGRSAEHIGISQLTFKKTKPSKERWIRDHLLEWDNNPSFDEFTILAHGSKKYLLEIKESLLIKRDQPVLNKNISSATLHLMSLVSY